MTRLRHSSLPWLAALIVLIMVTMALFAFWSESSGDPDEEGVKGKRRSGEAAEGLASFVEKRPARWPVATPPSAPRT